MKDKTAVIYRVVGRIFFPFVYFRVTFHEIFEIFVDIAREWNKRESLLKVNIDRS